MSMAIAHFAVGALCAVVIARAAAPEMVRSPSVLVAGGLWALLPDVHWVTPVYSHALHTVHQMAWMDLFFLHRQLDLLDPNNSRPLAGLIVAVSLLGVAVVEASVRFGSEDKGPDTADSADEPRDP